VVSYDYVLGYAGGVPDLVLESRAVIDRTVTAQIFAGLINVEALQSLVNQHFSPSEIAAIEASMP